MNARTTTRRLRELLAEEDGNIIALSTATIMVLVLVIMPIVMNAGVISTTRRFSQNGSDAAALAAAEEVARELSRDWTAIQCMPPAKMREIAEEYRATRVYPIGNSGIGGGAAGQYAAANRGDLQSYGQYTGGPHPYNWAGVRIPSITTMAANGADVRVTFIPSFYNLNGRDVDSVASAEAFMEQVIPLPPLPCPEESSTAVHPRFRFVWNVRIIDDPRD